MALNSVQERLDHSKISTGPTHGQFFLIANNSWNNLLFSHNYKHNFKTTNQLV